MHVYELSMYVYIQYSDKILAGVHDDDNGMMTTLVGFGSGCQSLRNPFSFIYLNIQYLMVMK